MNSKELQLVTFEQAKRLKKAGFDWECLRYYFTHYNNPDIGYLDEDADKYEYNWNSPDTSDLSMRLYEDSAGIEGMNIYSAPTTVLALKWMRDEKEIMCGVTVRITNDGYAMYTGDYRYSIIGLRGTTLFVTYESAESALLDELLTIIENKE